MAEFQAVIMAAGRGSRMYPLTENFPKSILPIGNIPLIWYPLNLLQNSGFEEVIVIVLESEKVAISHAISKLCETDLKVDLVSIADNQTMGTADSLRYIKDKIKNDVMILSCDLLADIQLHKLADVHRTQNASLSVLLTSNKQTEEEQQENKKMSKKDVLGQRDIIGLHQNRLLLLDAEDDLDERLIVHKSLLEMFPFVNIKSNLADAHLYIIKKWVVDFIVSNRSFNSLKGELIPYLIKKQYRKRRKDHNTENNMDDDVSGECTKIDIFHHVEKHSLENMSQNLSTSGKTSTEEIRCHCFITDSDLCLRVNTVPSFMQSNRLIPKILPKLCKKDLVHPLASVKKSQISDSMVDEGSQISEKVSIKKSIIGKHVTIAGKVKITNSVIMDHVTIKEGCNIHGCTVGNNAHLNENTSLKDCQVGESYTIPEGADLKGEAFAKGHMNI